MPFFRTGTGVRYNLLILILYCISDRAHALQRVSRALDNYHKLSSHHQKMLAGHAQHLATVRATVETNHLFVKTIVEKAAGMFENDPSITMPDPVES